MPAPLDAPTPSFLGVEEYVVQLYDKYAEGGVLPRQNFGQVCRTKATSLALSFYFTAGFSQSMDTDLSFHCCL